MKIGTPDSIPLHEEISSIPLHAEFNSIPLHAEIYSIPLHAEFNSILLHAEHYRKFHCQVTKTSRRYSFNQKTSGLAGKFSDLSPFKLL
jgi:hypothetical protein